MSIVDLLNAIKERGVELWFEGERLRFRAPKDALSAEQRSELSARRAEVVAQLRAEAAAMERIHPLSFSQRSLWFIHQQAPESFAYHVAMPLHIMNEVNVAAMRQALQALVDRHAILRTSYDFVEGTLSQRIAGAAPVVFAIHAVASLTDGELRAVVEEDYRRPFDLRYGPIFCASLYTRESANHILLLTVHHIAVDGWSLSLLIDELFKFYAEALSGVPTGLPRPELQYTDYVSWQERVLAGPEGDRLWSYWWEKLAPPREQLDLPVDYPRPAMQTFRGASRSIQFDAGLTQRVKDLALHESTTPFVVLLASFQALLFHWTGVEDIVVGTPAFGRSKAEFLRVVGDFVNPVPIRGRLHAAMTFRQLIGQLRLTVSEALDAQELPLPLLVERLQPERVAGHSPLFDTLFILQRFEQFRHIEALAAGDEVERAIEIAGLRLGTYPLHQQEGQLDLEVKLGEIHGGFFGTLAYRTDLFKETTIRGLVTDFLALVEALVGNSDMALGDHSIHAARQVTAKNNTISQLLDQLRRRDIRVFIEGDRLRVNAPKGMIDAQLQSVIAARRAEIIAALTAGIAVGEDHSGGGIRAVSRHGRLPVSSAQQRLWFLDQMEPGRSNYNIGGAVRLRGLLDIAAMQQAFHALVSRHESLRIRIVEQEGSPACELLESARTPVEIIDLMQTPVETRESAAFRRVEALLREPFAMARDPLVRFLVIRSAGDDHILAVCMHHAVSDGWSVMIAFREIFAFYDAHLSGRAVDLPSLPIQYVDYAAWEREQMSSGSLAGHLAYWKQQLHGAPVLLDLPTDRPRPAEQSFHGGRVRRYLDGQLIEALKMSRRF